MKLNKSRIQQPARFELLPLIDVIFLLLIFFIFVMLKMTMQNNIKVDLPQVAAAIQQTEETLTITIDATNNIFINEQNSSLAQLISNVSAIQKSDKKAILIRGDKRADLGIALTILDKLRQAGFKQVAFATEKQQ